MSKQLGNDHGGLLKGRKQFMKDLQEDVDYNEYKKKAEGYGCIHVSEDGLSSKIFMKVVKEFIKKQERA